MPTLEGPSLPPSLHTSQIEREVTLLLSSLSVCSCSESMSLLTSLSLPVAGE